MTSFSTGATLSRYILLRIRHNSRLRQSLIRVRHNIQRRNRDRGLSGEYIFQAQPVRHNFLTLIPHIDSAQLAWSTIDESVFGKCERERVIENTLVEVDCSCWLEDGAGGLDFCIGNTDVAFVEDIG